MLDKRESKHINNANTVLMFEDYKNFKCRITETCNDLKLYYLYRKSSFSFVRGPD